MQRVTKKTVLNNKFIGAAYWDEPEELFLAMVKGADMNTVSPENGYNALHWAVHNLSNDMLQVLVNYKGTVWGDRKEFDYLPKLFAKWGSKFGGEEKIIHKWESQAESLDLNHVNYDRKIARDCYPKHLPPKWYKKNREHINKFNSLMSGAEFIARDKFGVARNLSGMYEGPERINIIYKDFGI